MGGAASGTYVWWEGESTTDTNFPAKTAFSSSTFPAKRHVLSGGAWLTNAGVREGGEAYARYEVGLTDGGSYDLWCRKFWKHGPFRWRFDKGRWTVCPFDVALADSTHIRTHLGANWVFLGTVNLKSGIRQFELRLLAGEGENLVSAFDCFLLTKEPFMPRGALKPGEKTGRADTGRFAWEPAPDTFSDEAMLNLRYLNEKRAGENGWITREGMDFKRGDGKIIRFWAVNAGPGISNLDRLSVDYLARSLAKRGVNLVRSHGAVFEREAPDRINSAHLENLFYFVAAMKKQGIYTALSFYFPLWASVNESYRLDGYEKGGNKHPFALLFYVPRMQELHRNWLKALMTTPSPDTGVPLGRDPAVAMVEIQNEDSFFFWTFGKKNVPAPHWEKLERLFGAWALTRYGTAGKIQAAWLEAREENDDLENGRAALYEAWHMTHDGMKNGGPGFKRRVSDQVRFLTQVQRGFFKETARYFHKELGARNLLVAGNWTTADPSVLEAVEHYTYTACDVLDRHGYFEGKHEGEGSSYSVRDGHEFGSKSALKHPEGLPIQFTQVQGRPQIISEIGWPNPNLYRAEMPFLACAYGSLQGLDAVAMFALGSADWDNGMGKFTFNSPAIMGNSPAYALCYRRGDIREAGNVVYQAMRPEDLYLLEPSGAHAAQALDNFRKADVPEGGELGGKVRSIDPLSFYVGRVVRSFSSKKRESRQVDLSPYVDRRLRTVKSMTGELEWNYGRGVVTINARLSQGAAGFLSQAGEVKLRNVAIEAGNDYATVMAVSLDGLSLFSSRRILVQAMTTERPYGFKASGGKDGRIESIGEWPWGVERIRVRVSITGKKWADPKVTALDESGYPRRAVNVDTELSEDGKSLAFDLAEDSAYHIVSR